MTWITRLLRGRTALHPACAPALAAYRALARPDPAGDIRRMRFVVVDVETSGLDLRRERLLAIGAVAVEAMLLRFDDSFSAYLRQPVASSNENILVHGIDGTTQVSAPDSADGLAAFLRYAGKAPLVAFHAGFDRMAIDRALRAALGVSLENTWLDLAKLAPALLPEGAAFTTLDAWTDALGIANYRRHDALADAAATAQLLQVVLARSIACGDTRLVDLERAQDAQRWLERG